ncbi:MAG: hypothetical protein AMJ90_00200 [candidate division Zixibacteria bacterium SM23_73_2]|nr:MAG: hypothetical protein AMJ90_00200 [candidate division Zixibacteria bacterium SM23_73_2]
MLKYFERKVKRFFFRLAGFFLKSSPKQKEDIDLSKIKKILVVRQDERIGNLILTTPFLWALKDLFPQARIFYLASKTFGELFSNYSVVEGIFAVNKKRYIFWPFSLLKMVNMIREEKFDLCFDLSDENQISANNFLYTALSGAKYRVGYKKEGSENFLNIEAPIKKEPKHAVDMHLELLRFLFGEVPIHQLSVDISVDSEKLVLDYLAGKGVNDKDFLVGINLGGRGKKRWGGQNFFRLADFLVKEFNFKVILIWGPEEKALVKDLILGGNIILADLFPLPTLAALIRRTDLFISSDSGVMHLSAAVGTPTFAIFLDSDPVKYGPWGEKHKIIVGEEGEVSVERVKEKLHDFVISLPNEDKNFKSFRDLFDKTSPVPSPYKGEGRGKV